MTACVRAITTHHEMVDAQLKKRVPTERRHECSNTSNAMYQVLNNIEVSRVKIFGNTEKLRNGTYGAMWLEIGILWGRGRPSRKPPHDFPGTTRKLRKGKERFGMGGRGTSGRAAIAAVHNAIHVFPAHQWTFQRKGPRTYDFFRGRGAGVMLKADDSADDVRLTMRAGRGGP